MITMKMLVKKFYDELREANLAHYADSYEKSKWNVIIYIKSGGNDVLFNEWCKENCNDEYIVHNEHYVLFETNEDGMAFKLMFA